jgi:AcrR family transcriptional regulator
MSSTLPMEEKLDPRIRRTRNLLSQAFSDVLAKKGFQAVTVQDIAEKAGVNRTTFYLHFPDKYALLDYSISLLFRQDLEKRTLNLCHFTPENLRSLIIAVAEFVAFSSSHCTSTDPQFETLVEAQVKKQVEQLLQVWGEKAGFGPDPESAAVAASWAIYGLVLQWSHDKKRPPAEQLSDRILPLIQAILLGQTQPA